MPHSQLKLISVIVPVFNEAEGLQTFHASLITVMKTLKGYKYEIIYCDDGSTDNSSGIIKQFADDDKVVKLVKLSRNFGKENALTAGIAAAAGQAIITLDGDGQHPVEYIPRFIDAWQGGAKVVIGVSTDKKREGIIKKLGSRLFYASFSGVTRQNILPGSTDFRLIDESVRREFLRLSETNRMTRGLIDWLGFERAYVPFITKVRSAGVRGYSIGQLIKLAADSYISASPAPLYLFGYAGMTITFFASILGGAVLIEQLIMGDPLSWNFTGTAMLGILILFLVGLVLLSQGILSMYVSRIHSESKQRPLYIIDYDGSAGIKELPS